MTDNVPLTNVFSKDEQLIERVRKRLRNRYFRASSWRKVAVELGLNWRYVWEFVEKGIVPKDRQKRQALGLPQRLPSERKSAQRAKRVVPKVWESPELYMRKVKR